MSADHIPKQQLNETPKKENLISIKSQSSEEADFDPDSPNQKFFNLADIKPLDLKAHWMGNTHEVINKFDRKMQDLKKEKAIMKEGIQRFMENANRFRINSLRKINFEFDKKALYLQFMKRSRKTVQKLHPSLLIIIFSYIQANVFLAMTKMRRVSQIFNYIYKNQQVTTLFSVKDFGTPDISLDNQVKFCKKYVSFSQTFLYYKQIKYTILIPQNSIKQDLQQAVDFINEIYKKVYKAKSLQIGYFSEVNRFMRTHRVAIALQSLSFADLAMTRKGAILAFSNYLSLNPPARLKQQITKTKYLKMIELVEGQDCQDSLVVNSKISNFLLQEHNYEIAVFVDTLKTVTSIDFPAKPKIDLVVFHYHNPNRSFFMKGVQLQSWKIEVGDVHLQFSEDMKRCRFSYSFSDRWQTQMLNYRYMPTVAQNSKFGHSYIYRGEFYYVLVIKDEVEVQQAV